MKERIANWMIAFFGTTVLVVGFQNCGTLNALQEKQDFPPVSQEAGRRGYEVLQDLNGQWNKPCGAGELTQASLKFDRNGRAFLAIDVGVQDCRPLISAELDFQYQIGEPMALDSGETVHRLLAKGVERGNVTPLTAEVAETFNQRFYCGVGNWQQGQPRRVKFENCHDPQGHSLVEPFLRRNIFYIGEDGLRMGSSQWMGQDGFPEALELAVFQRGMRR